MKPLSGKVLTLEIRVTPYDQLPITIEESDLQMFDKLLLCEEGIPNGTPRLHYHGFIETKKSESWLRLFLRKIAHAPDNEKVNGNSLYFTRKCHEHTHGYIVKSGNISYRHGITQTTLDEWLENSNQYAKDKSSERKRKQRTRDDELATVVKTVEEGLKNDFIQRNPNGIVTAILNECYHTQIRFPSRTQMEHFVLKLIYPYDDQQVRSFYLKSFPCYTI